MSTQHSQVPMINRVAALLPEAAPDVANYIELHDDSTELQSMYLSLIVDTSRAVVAQGSKNQRSSEHASLVSLVTRLVGHDDIGGCATVARCQACAQHDHAIRLRTTRPLLSGVV
jgi:hypothetical protein